MPYNDFQYLDPLHIVWRKGTPEDPYTQRVEFLKVVNQTIVLSEIPDKVYRVRISGLNEINYETFNKKGLGENEFYVNYSTGIIQVHAKYETETLNVTYKGRGFIQYPADRIYYADKYNNVVTSLKNIIETMRTNADELNERFADFDKVLRDAEEAINNTNSAIDSANEATEDSIVATEKAWYAHDTTILIWKEYVNKYEDIAVKFPNPEFGWTVAVYETGERFRYDGDNWVAIDAIGNNVPDATELNKGLMSKEHFIKLRDISDNTDVKIMYFVLPEDILQGIQPPKLKFDVKGKILDVEAYVGTKGLQDLPIDIQISNDLENWSSILDFDMVIEGGSYNDNALHTVLNDVVEEDNYYRVFVKTFTADARDLQVKIKMKMD